MKSLFKRHQNEKSSDTEQIQLAEFNIMVIRSKRKSISLQIKPEGILLRAPLFSPRVMLKAFALSKIEWLRKHQERLKHSKATIKRSYTSGEQWLLFGENITLDIQQGKTSQIQLHEETHQLEIIIGIRVKQQQPFIQKKLADFYKDIGHEYLTNIIHKYANAMNVEFNSFKIRDYKARWGSCSSQGDLSFNWRIFMAPKSVIDSVVVHELAHLKHFNHSPKFWRLVFSIYPDYDQQHQWLKDNQHQLQA